jgi:general secretion pathway protein G
MKKNFKGFTLIEILVTVSIIGLLTMIGVTNFKVANQKARDGRRQGDLEQIRAALELYRTEENAYPTDDIIGADSIESPTGTVYMDDVPADPVSAQTYSYSSDGNTYTLCAAMELDTTGTCSVGNCGTGITCNYEVNSPL